MCDAVFATTPLNGLFDALILPAGVSNPNRVNHWRSVVNASPARTAAAMN
jgi:hypothetical protein